MYIRCNISEELDASKLGGTRKEYAFTPTVYTTPLANGWQGGTFFLKVVSISISIPSIAPCGHSQDV